MRFRFQRRAVWQLWESVWQVTLRDAELVGRLIMERMEKPRLQDAQIQNWEQDELCPLTPMPPILIHAPALLGAALAVQQTDQLAPSMAAQGAAPKTHTS